MLHTAFGRPTARVAIGALTVALLAASIAPATSTAAPTPLAGKHRGPRALAIEAVSNRHPEFVSGGDVMVRVTVPAGVRRREVRVTRNGVDVTSSFEVGRKGTMLGVVEGLRLDRNTLAVSSGRGRRHARLMVVNHPITGPVFSGRQQLPFFCETHTFGLPPAEQPACSAPTQVTYQYRSTTGRFLPLANPTLRPPDLATTTVRGRVVPYIVRVERGTINRAVYEIAALYSGHGPRPLGRDEGWNGRLVYTFGGGCNGGYHQGRGTGGVVEDMFLSRGYAVASSSLNVLNNNCSPIISAETAMMVKEHVIETYGPVRHTIGWGGSGGAIQQYDIADSYPGILDGIIPGVSYPDPLSTLGPVVDCRLLRAYFATRPTMFTEEQRRAIAGFATDNVCRSWDITFANRVTATDSCDPAIPVTVRWHPVTNPDGVRCAAIEQVVNQLGRDPSTGFVRSPLDNVGVPYGLQALRDGVITAEQFVDLNERIGGVDVRGALSSERSRADRRALRVAYRDNLVNSGGQGLATTAVIDLRMYLDDVAAGFADIHTAEWSYVMRERMIEEGTVGNQVILEFAPAHSALANTYAFEAMERWLTAIGREDRPRSLARRIVQNRPADLADGCFLPGGTRITEPLSYDGTGQCATEYPIFSNPRLVAGEPLTRDILKCRRMPLDLRQFPVTFTTSQQVRLRQAFPNGVCDYRRSGVGERSPRGTWLSYPD